MLLLKAGQQASVISHADRQAQFAAVVALDGHIDIDSIDDNTVAAEAIEINIPAFSDGRGFSVARHLRMSKKYRGVLRATGGVLPDQLQALFQVGFDEVLVGDVNLAKHSEQDWLNAHGAVVRQESLLPSYHESTFVGQGSVWARRMM